MTLGVVCLPTLIYLLVTVTQVLFRRLCSLSKKTMASCCENSHIYNFYQSQEYFHQYFSKPVHSHTYLTGEIPWSESQYIHPPDSPSQSLVRPHRVDVPFYSGLLNALKISRLASEQKFPVEVFSYWYLKWSFKMNQTNHSSSHEIFAFAFSHLSKNF